MKQKTYYVRRKGTAKIVHAFFCGGDLERAKRLFAALYTPRLYYLSNDKGETL